MVYVFLADGFEEIEAVVVIDILRRANIAVKTVSIEKSLNVQGTHGISLVSDLYETDLDLNETDCIILPGGIPGIKNLKRSETVKKAIAYCVENNKYIAAICAAPSILGEMGLLKGKKAVCYPGFSDKLVGANVMSENVCIDGNIISAVGPGAVFDFSLKIVDVLSGKEVSNKIEDNLLCR